MSAAPGIPDLSPRTPAGIRGCATSRATVVVHGEAMVAEAVAAALNSYPAIAVIGVATTLSGMERWEERTEAVALDRYLPRAREATVRLRGNGVRVVLMGEAEGELDDVSVSTRAPISALAQALVPGAPGGRRRRGLTPREREVLTLAAAGLTANQVASRLGISVKTVEQRKGRAFAKLGVTNQAAAIRVALSSGQGPWLHRLSAREIS